MADTPLRADSVRANPIARRDMLAAVLVTTAAVAAPCTATTLPSPQLISEDRDSHFWVALERYRVLVDRFEAWPCKTFEQEAARDAGVADDMHRAMQVMGGIAVHTLPALAAKMAAFREFPDCDVGNGRFTLFEVAIMDVERMMVAEMVG